jgi:hypothetical protein
VHGQPATCALASRAFDGAMEREREVDGLRPGPPAAGDVEVGAGFAAGDVGRLRRGT